jgi:hypothetical protein
MMSSSTSVLDGRYTEPHAKPMDSCATVVELPGCSLMGLTRARVILTELSHALPTVQANSMVPKFCVTLRPTGCPAALSGVQPQEEVAVMKLQLFLLAVSTSPQSGTVGRKHTGRRHV